MKFSIKNMKFSIKNMKFSIYEICQNSSFVLFVTEFSYHMYRKNAVLNGKQKQMKPLHILIGKFSYFVIRFLNQIFFVINFSYFIIRFLLNSSIVKSDNEIGKVNDKKNVI